jgi:hypothetical protein
MLLIGSALLGLGVTRRAWMIALAVGVWIPGWMVAHSLVEKPALVASAVPVGCVVLAVTMAGAYLGMGVRRLATYSGQRV